MADPIAVAREYAIAEKQLVSACEQLSKEIGVAFKPVPPLSKREPRLASMHLTKNAADFVKQVAGSLKQRPLNQKG